MSAVPPCNRCGATLLYDAAHQAMRCPYCGTLQAAGAAGPTAGAIREIPLQEGLMRAARGLGAPVSTVLCTTCGAVVNAGFQEVATTCAFCRSAVVAQQTDPNLIRPESLVPFLFSREMANQYFAQWLRTLWFRPNSLSQLARVQMIDGVYVPFWTFDARVHSDWTARAGYYRYETEYYTEKVDGRSVRRSRRVRLTDWSPASGSRDDAYDDLLVCASRGLPPDLVQEIAPFDTKRLVPYDPSFLAGWRAESYSLELEAGWTQVTGTITASQRTRCGRDVPGDTHDSLKVTDHFTAITFKHVLLPIWLGVYWHGNKPFRFLVNGQTGEVVGKAPWSFWKIFGIFIFFGAFTIVYFIVALLHDAGYRLDF